MARLYVLVWNRTRNVPIQGASVTVEGTTQKTLADGVAYMGFYNVGEHAGVATPPPGFEPPNQTFSVEVPEGEITRRVLFEESAAIPSPPPPGFGQPIETYKGIDIYLREDTGAYYYFIAGIEYGYFTSIEIVRADLDKRLGQGPPPETPKAETVTTVPVASGLGWLQGVADWFGGLTRWNADQAAANAAGLKNAYTAGAAAQATEFNKLGAEMAGVRLGVGNMGPDLIGGLVASMSDIVQKTIQEALDNVITKLPEATGNSPEWKQKVKATLDPYANSLVAQIRAETDPSLYAHSPITPEEAKDALNKIAAGVVAVEIGLFIAHAALEGATLGQVEAISQFENMVVSKLGLNSIASAAVEIPLDELVMKKARQFYAAEYTPEIPGYSDLVNMRVKEKIDQPTFEKNLAYNGYSKDWAGLIWEAHFQAPGLQDIVTAWRRGLIDEKRVDELMILVDLDPFYKQVFDVRKYVDPSLTLARYMFETGAIDEARVADIVHREGYTPTDAAYIVDFIVHFQERQYRRRYLTALSTGYSRGVYDQGQLSKAVLEAGFTQGTADWIVKTAEVRKEIIAKAKTGGGPKLLALGDLKKAYINDKLTEDTLRTELLTRGYELGDVQTLIEVLNLDKTEAVEGRRVVALSVSELINAFRYGVKTEDEVRTELQLRGLSLDEVNTLIETKKRAWGIGTPTS